ncbi:hypothetical protein [Cellulomonas xylanilytica]|uniref:Uncharacterized protein n=1 Tax=Cellulomonas xylanilytica TaxID=233583 RepID=A0A510V8H4_9CELL|nr:hypothetical protein [Cellulomonas xylanilytica]GEK23167.1 hypothetical protein CXY01_36870 [Cellulomonas xylanilytica]
MDPVARAENRVADLRALLHDFREARNRAPALTSPADAVGARGTWTGTAADRLHRENLAPMSGSLPRDLDRAEDAILGEIAHAERAARTARDRATNEPA